MLIPHKMDFGESSHVCAKISGRIADYVTESSLLRLVHHLAKPQHQEARNCLTDQNKLQVFVGGTDRETEGLWTTIYSKDCLNLGMITTGCK